MGTTYQNKAPSKNVHVDVSKCHSAYPVVKALNEGIVFQYLPVVKWNLRPHCDLGRF